MFFFYIFHLIIHVINVPLNNIFFGVYKIYNYWRYREHISCPCYMIYIYVCVVRGTKITGKKITVNIINYYVF